MSDNSNIIKDLVLQTVDYQLTEIALVSDELANGWELYGSPVLNREDEFLQPMVKYEKRDAAEITDLLDTYMRVTMEVTTKLTAEMREKMEAEFKSW